LEHLILIIQLSNFFFFILFYFRSE